MLKDKSIICFAGEDWWYHHPHSKNHIMRRFARAGNRVMFVNSISMGLPSLKSPDLFEKIRRKLRSYAKAVRQTEEGIVVVSPVALPFYSSPIARALNALLLAFQIKCLMIAFDFRDPILWIAIPTALGVAGRLGEKVLIYQVSDKYDSNQMDHATTGSVIRAMHHELLEKADLVYFSGRKLYEEELVANQWVAAKSKFLEQAVDFEHFASATSSRAAAESGSATDSEAAIGSPLSRRKDASTDGGGQSPSRGATAPEDISAIPRPRLGYFGAVDSWLMDQDLIRYVSRLRPEWQWVLLGLRAATLDIESLPNVHYLGSRPYQDMPRYAAEFDVCVLPWVTDNAFVSYGSAIKVREYLATGKPVVITPLYEYESLDGILRIARGYDDFIIKIEDALANDTEAQKQARQDAVRNATWEARTEAVSGHINAALERSRA